MPVVKFKEVTEATGAKVSGVGCEEFSAVVTDTRKIQPDCLFIALKGEKFNGEDFAGEAVQKGAAGVMVSQACPGEKTARLNCAVLTVPDTLKAYQEIAGAWRKKFSLPVIAITGSNGKTTTKDLTAAALSAKGPVLKTAANYNNEVGLPLTLLGLNDRHTAAVVEIGMRGLGQIKALAPVAAPNIAIVTNVGETHIELLGSVENIAKAKAELVEAIGPGGTVILNADNDYVAAMREKAAPGVNVITFGLDKDADVKGENLVTQGNKTSFSAVYRGQGGDYRLPLLGRHNVYNALAAIAAGFTLGLGPEEIRQGLANPDISKMRFACQKIKEYQVIDDTYNASPMSMEAAIGTTAEIASGRKVAVLGDMLELGESARTAHLNVGKLLLKYGFAALVTRGERAAFIAEAAKDGGMKEVYRAASHEEAAAWLHKILQPGDTVLFKGSRGMHMDKIIEMI